MGKSNRVTITLMALIGLSAYAGTELGNGRFVNYHNGVLGVRFLRPEAWQPLDGGAVVLFQDSSNPVKANRMVLEGALNEDILLSCQWETLQLANGVSAAHCRKSERAGELRVRRSNGLDISMRYQLKGDEFSHEALGTLLSSLEIESGAQIR